MLERMTGLPRRTGWRALALLSAVVTLGCGGTPGRPALGDSGASSYLRGQWSSGILSDGSRLTLAISTIDPSVRGQGTLLTRVLNDTGSTPGPAIPVVVTGTPLSRPAILELRYSVGGGSVQMRLEVTAIDSLHLSGILHQTGDFSERVTFTRQ